MPNTRTSSEAYDAVRATLFSSTRMDNLLLLLEEWNVPFSPNWTIRKAALWRNFQKKTLCHDIQYYYGSDENAKKYCAKCVSLTKGPYSGYECHFLTRLQLPNMHCCDNCCKMLTHVGSIKCEKCVQTFEQYLASEKRILYPGDKFRGLIILQGK